MHLVKRSSPQEKTVKPVILTVTAIVISLLLLFWTAALFFAYLADEWRTPIADERSKPAARSY